jgi:GNAT superfamily N-acetyltransferase
MIMVREAVEGDAEGLARAHVESWKSTYRGLVPDPYLDALDVSTRTREFQEWMREPVNRFLYVAESLEGKIVGFVSGGPDRDTSGLETSELYALYLLAEYQRKGIGRKLFKVCVDRLKQMGYRRMILYSLAGNPHQAFYAAMEGKEDSTSRILRIGGGGMDFRLVQ